MLLSCHFVLDYPSWTLCDYFFFTWDYLCLLALPFAFRTLMNVIFCHVRRHSASMLNAIIGLKYTSSRTERSLFGTWTNAFLESCIFSKSSFGRRLFLSLAFSFTSKVRLSGPESLGVRLVFCINLCEPVISVRTLGGSKSVFELNGFTKSPLTSSSEDSVKSAAVSDSLCLFAWFAYLLTDKVRCPVDVRRLVEWVSAPVFTIPHVSSEFSSLSLARFNPSCAVSLRFATKALGKLRLRLGLLWAFPAKSKSKGSDQE